MPFFDVYGLLNGNVAWLNRVDVHNSALNIAFGGHHSGNFVSVIVSNLSVDTHVRINARKGKLFFNNLGWLAGNVLAPPSAYVHGDNVYTSVSSSSDARLKTELSEVSGTQALRILPMITCQTFNAFEERRLGLIADEVQAHIEELAIDNVVGSKVASKGEGEPPHEYLTLQYERPVPLLIASVNELSQRANELANANLESQVNGATREPGA